MAWWRGQWSEKAKRGWEGGWEGGWGDGWQESGGGSAGSAPAATPRSDAWSAGGYAPDEREKAAAVAETFAKRSRREQALFEEAASATPLQRSAAYGREKLHDASEYLSVNWPKAGHQLYGPAKMRSLEEFALASGVVAKLRGRGPRHPSRNQERERRTPRLVLLGPRGAALQVALEFVKAAERVLGTKRLRRARRYLTAAAGDESITDADRHIVVEPARRVIVEPDSDDSESSEGSEEGDAGGSAPEDDQATDVFEDTVDWGDDEVFFSGLEGNFEEGGASSSGASPPARPSASASASASDSSSQTRFWAVCRKALSAACGTGTNAGRMRAVIADLELQLASLSDGRLDWQSLRSPCPGEPRIALASHAMCRDFQVRVALPLQCMALLRSRNVGRLQLGKGV